MAYTFPVIGVSALEGIDLTYTQQPYVESPLSGDPSYPALPFRTGTRIMTGNNGTACYVLTTGAVNLSDFVAVTSTYTAAQLTATNATTAVFIGCATFTAIASGYAGWVAEQGTVTGNVLASCAANVALYATATPGYLDDAAATTAILKLNGVVAVTAKSTTPGSTSIVMTYPSQQE